MGARITAAVQTDTEAHPAPYTMGTGSFLGGKNGQGVALTTHRRIVPRLKKEYGYNSTPLLGLRGMFWGEI